MITRGKHAKQNPPSDVWITRQMTTNRNSEERIYDDSTHQTQNTNLNPGCSTHIQTQSQATILTQHQPIKNHLSHDVDTDQPSCVPHTISSNDESDTNLLDDDPPTVHLYDHSDDDSDHDMDPQQAKTHMIRLKKTIHLQTFRIQ